MTSNRIRDLGLSIGTLPTGYGTLLLMLKGLK